MEGQSTKTKSFNLSFMLTALTFLFIFAQLALFITHYRVTELLDSLVASSLSSNFISWPIVGPIISFIATQIVGYILIVLWIWFVANSLADFFRFTKLQTYFLGITIWALTCFTMLLLNKYYYSHSFFAELLNVSTQTNTILLILSLSCLTLCLVLAYVNVLFSKKFILLGTFFLTLLAGYTALSFYEKMASWFAKPSIAHTQPNIIIIGLDSVRPDFINYYGTRKTTTPHLDNFLKSSVNFLEAYTPMARTFPAWISILTGVHPKHANVRNNLPNPSDFSDTVTVAKILKKAGYETLYATDEKRFSNITKVYGFDKVIGPKMGINDFILGGLSDFPLANLMINSVMGKYLFPYNYANRAAAITYKPQSFVTLVKQNLNALENKPVFLAIHLCTSHWPFTWAGDQQSSDELLTLKYSKAIERVDQQFGQLLKVMRERGLLKNSLVIVLSDHGTTLGMPGDRSINEKDYIGDLNLLKVIPRFHYSFADPAEQFKFRLNTSYGQGSDVLSLKQYRTLLAVKSFGFALVPQQVSTRVSLLDIAPTVLDFLKLPPLKIADGFSFKEKLFNVNAVLNHSRAFFLESGHSIAAIQQGNIDVNEVVSASIAHYRVNPVTGLLSLSENAEHGIIKDKQYAVLMDDWMLAIYPSGAREVFVEDDSHSIKLKSVAYPAFYVLVNLKTQQWGVGLGTDFAKSAPVAKLLALLQGLYGDEVKARA